MLKQETILTAARAVKAQLDNGEVLPIMMEDILATIGETIGATRAAYYRIQSDAKQVDRLSLQREWATPGTTPRDPDDEQFQHLSMRELDLNTIYDTLKSGKPLLFQYGSIPTNIQAQVFFPADARGVLMLPILVGNQLWGLIQLVTKDDDHVWELQDLTALEQFTTPISNKIQQLQQNELERRRQALLRISKDDALSQQEKIESALKVGLDYLKLAIAIVSHIEGDTYTVKYFHPPESGLEHEQVFDLGQTYCSITLGFSQVVSIPHMFASEFNRHPCYAAFQLESYIGVPLVVNGSPYGTVNFSSGEPHHGFSANDRQFIQDVAEWVSKELSA